MIPGQHLRAGAFGVAALLLAACSREPGDFAVEISGPAEGTIRGGAIYCVSPDGGDFVALLRDPDSGTGMELRRETPGLPPPGSYGIASSLGERTPGSFVFTPRLDDLEGAGDYAYRVRGGQVRIVSADSSWLEGRFEVEMVGTDASPEVDSAAGMVRALPPVTATLRGRFAAARVASCSGLGAAGP